MPRRNERLRSAGLTLVASACLGACVAIDRAPRTTEEALSSRPPGVISMQEAKQGRERLAAGSIKADVADALGKAASVLVFDSGFEVWVYRVPSSEQKAPRDAELVLLFAPSGTLAKTRLRVPPGARNLEEGRDPIPP